MPSVSLTTPPTVPTRVVDGGQDAVADGAERVVDDAADRADGVIDGRQDAVADGAERVVDHAADRADGVIDGRAGTLSPTVPSVSPTTPPTVPTVSSTGRQDAVADGAERVADHAADRADGVFDDRQRVADHAADRGRRGAGGAGQRTAEGRCGRGHRIDRVADQAADVPTASVAPVARDGSASGGIGAPATSSATPPTAWSTPAAVVVTLSAAMGWLTTSAGYAVSVCAALSIWAVDAVPPPASAAKDAGSLPACGCEAVEASEVPAAACGSGAAAASEVLACGSGAAAASEVLACGSGAAAASEVPACGSGAAAASEVLACGSGAAAASEVPACGSGAAAASEVLACGSGAAAASEVPACGSGAAVASERAGLRLRRSMAGGPVGRRPLGDVLAGRAVLRAGDRRQRTMLRWDCGGLGRKRRGLARRAGSGRRAVANGLDGRAGGVEARDVQRRHGGPLGQRLGSLRLDLLDRQLVYVVTVRIHGSASLGLARALRVERTHDHRLLCIGEGH